jgi:DNA-binding FadR family transcriptional regulator
VKLATRNADRIAELIGERGLSTGDYLGSEPELAALLGSSRWTLREALTILEREGRVQIRRGRQGGVYVAEPNSESVSLGLRSYLEFLQVGTDQIGQARAILDHAVLVLALTRLRTADVAQLRSAGDVESREHGLEAGFVQYRALLAVAGNPVLTALVRAVSQLGISALLRSRLSATELDDTIRQVRRLRREQIEAVIAGSLEGSLAIEADILAINARLLESVAGADEGQAGAVPPDAVALLSSSRQFKRPELLMQQIAADVVRRRWPVGEHLGGEAELMARYGVSRSVFREAVRALERNGVVTMQTGRHSGLKVSAPRLDAVLNAAAAQFAAMGVTPTCAAEALHRLALGAVGIMRFEALSPECEVAESLPDVMCELARASGNPILELFAQVCRAALGGAGARLGKASPDLTGALHARDRALVSRALIEAMPGPAGR